jgi:hypothetical protein
MFRGIICDNQGGVESSSNSISGNYSKFSGYYYKEVKFAKGDNINFTYLISTNDGKLSAKLLDSSGDVIEKITKDTTITIPKEDTYKIQVNAKDHKGSFIISWDED